MTTINLYHIHIIFYVQTVFTFKLLFITYILAFIVQLLYLLFFKPEKIVGVS